MIQKLQIALDLLNLDRALSIAKEAVDAVAHGCTGKGNDQEHL